MDHKRSFTLLEIIITVAILSVGIVFIYEGFFTTLAAHQYCQNYLEVQNWTDQKIWNIQDILTRYQTLITQENKGIFKIKEKEFNWKFSAVLLEGAEKFNLYEIVLDVTWQEGIRNINFKRATYAMYSKKLEEKNEK